MKINQNDILDIIQNVGGKDNISLLTHCVTRLRFVLKDESLINEKALKENFLVKGCFSVKGQYQVIIGPGLVDQVYDLVLAETGAKEADSSELKDVEDKAMNPLQKALKLFSDVFYPILPAIVGAGLLLGISNILTNAGIFGKESLVVMYPAIAGLADMITMVANTAFTYIPVLVAWSAVKRFGGSPMLGVLLGLVLINGDLIPGSQMSSVISGAIEPQYWNIFGIDILKIGYQNSVLPALVAAWVLVILEKWLKKQKMVSCLEMPCTGLCSNRSICVRFDAADDISKQPRWRKHPDPAFQFIWEGAAADFQSSGDGIGRTCKFFYKRKSGHCPYNDHSFFSRDDSVSGGGMHDRSGSPAGKSRRTGDCQNDVSRRMSYQRMLWIPQ